MKSRSNKMSVQPILRSPGVARICCILHLFLSTFHNSSFIWVFSRDRTGEKFVTFVVGAGNETTLSIQHVNDANEHVMAVARMIRDIHSESQYLWKRQKSQMTTVQSTHSRTFWLSLFELTVICIMISVQIYLLKSLVSNKRLF